MGEKHVVENVGDAGDLNILRETTVGEFRGDFPHVPIAAGVLYPFFGLLLSPMIAAAAMSLSSLSVVTNALRLRQVAL